MNTDIITTQSYSTKVTQTFSTNPLLPIGSWVQLNMGSPYAYKSSTSTSPLQVKRGYPSIAERTIGVIRSAYVAQGTQYYQIVWNPRGTKPETGMYTVDQLTPLSDQAAQAIQQQMAQGTYAPQGGWNAGQ